jgi:hypothetical protein
MSAMSVFSMMSPKSASTETGGSPEMVATSPSRLANQT